MMKSSTLFHVFECGPLPPYVHLTSTRRHSRDRCSQAFPVFRAVPSSCIILNTNRRTKNGVGLGTRLVTNLIHRPPQRLLLAVCQGPRVHKFHTESDKTLGRPGNEARSGVASSPARTKNGGAPGTHC